MSNINAPNSLAEIASKALHERIQAGESVDLIDVRTAAEYQTVHALPARHVAAESLDPSAFIASRGDRQGEPIYVICASGGRSRGVCNQFRATGFQNVVNVNDGTSGWERAGLPVVRGTRKVIALDRQVRIASGSIALVGTLLGALVHLGFLVIPAFIGSGLLYSGVTDNCGMAMILAKMPWNRSVG